MKSNGRRSHRFESYRQLYGGVGVIVVRSWQPPCTFGDAGGRFSSLNPVATRTIPRADWERLGTSRPALRYQPEQLRVPVVQSIKEEP